MALSASAVQTGGKKESIATERGEDRTFSKMQGAVFDAPTPHLPVQGRPGLHVPVGRVFCVGKNYAKHAVELGCDPEKEPPVFFLKAASCVVHAPEGTPLQARNRRDRSNDAPLVLMSGYGDAPPPFPASRCGTLLRRLSCTTRWSWWPSSGVSKSREPVSAGAPGHLHRMPRACTHRPAKPRPTVVPREDALAYVWGWCVGLDMTRRDVQNEARQTGGPWDMSKSFDDAAPCADVSGSVERDGVGTDLLAERVGN